MFSLRQGLTTLNHHSSCPSSLHLLLIIFSGLVTMPICQATHKTASMLVTLTRHSADLNLRTKCLKYDYSNLTYWPVLNPVVAVYYAARVDSYFVYEALKCDHSNENY